MNRQTGVIKRWAVVLVATIGFSCHVAAETVLIGAGVRNGDFNADVSSTDSRNFDVTPNWFNIGSGSDQSVECTRTNLPVDGSRHAVLSSDGNRVHAQNTGYTNQIGDFFQVRYEWRDGFQWNPADRVEVRLFVTDTDLIGGTQTMVASLLSEASASSNAYQAETAITPVVAPAAVGKTLFVGLYIMDGNGDTNDFAQLDNFELTVNPDPVSETLIGPGVRNGDFNDDVSTTDSRNFDVTPGWYNIGTGIDQSLECTRTNLPVDNTRNAVLNSSGSRVPAQSTDYVVRPGDVFRVRYDWRDASGFDDAQDRVEIRLFVTDNDGILGNQTVVASMVSLLSNNDNQYQEESGVSTPADPAWAGKKLFAGLYIDDANGDANDFVRFDNLELVVNPPADEVLVGPGVNNGDFNEDTSDAISRTFEQTPSWWNLGAQGQTAECTRTNDPFDGTRFGVAASSSNRILSINPVYTIGSGDVFRVSLVWKDGNGWDPADQVEVRMFVTDNDKIGGTQTVLASLLSGASTLSNTFEMMEADSPAATGAFIGKRLFMLIDVQDGNGDGDDFAPVDDVQLLANPGTALAHMVSVTTFTLGPSFTLHATGVSTHEPAVEYTTDLLAEPQVWIPVTLITNSFADGTNVMVFGAPGAGPSYALRVVDSPK